MNNSMPSSTKKIPANEILQRKLKSLDLSDLSFLPSFYDTNVLSELKTKVIERALKNNDLSLLCVLGRSKYGFVNNRLRRQAWYMILKSQLINVNENPVESEQKHCDENQIKLDVNRSFGYVKDESLRLKLKESLEFNIIRFFRKYPKLRYYQGYHDIVSIFIMLFIQDFDDKNYNSVLYHTTLFQCIELFSLVYLRDFLMDSLDFPIDQVKLIPLIISAKDHELYEKLHLNQVEPFFAISSILTIFSHDIKPHKNDKDVLIYQIFDLVICTQSMYVPLILYSNVIIACKSNLLSEFTNSGGDFENEVDLVHVIIQKVLLKSITTEPSASKNIFNNVLNETRSNYTLDKKTTKKLSKRINKASPLKTTAVGILFSKVYDGDMLESLIDLGVKLNRQEKEQRERRSSNNDLEHNKDRSKYNKLLKLSLVVVIASLVIRNYEVDASLLNNILSPAHFEESQLPDILDRLVEPLKIFKQNI